MAIVLVTGGAGFIGSHLVDRLLDGPDVVRVLDNLARGGLGNLGPGPGHGGTPDRAGLAPAGRRLELMVGDVRDEKLVRGAMRNVDCVFHLAGLTPASRSADRPWEVHSVNVQGTLNVLEAALSAGVRRVVFASCGSVYGRDGGTLLTEAVTARPASLFAASKLAGEIYCRAYSGAHGLETVALRYFAIYGPRQESLAGEAPGPSLLGSLRRGVHPDLLTGGPGADDLLYVDDAVDATLAAATAPGAVGLSVNVASGSAVSSAEVRDILSQLLGAGALPAPPRVRSARPPRRRVDVSLARDVLGCTPSVSLVTGLSRVVQFALEGGRTAVSTLAEVGSREERADV